jgi:hypothetical protein
MKYIYSICFILCSFVFVNGQNPDDDLIIKYIGQDKIANSSYHDGQMRPAIGTQNYQILRANRTNPEMAEGTGWTYNHAPMLAYWNGHFICEYLSNPMGEHVPPGITLIAKSKDGMNWDKPQIAFPIYFTTEVIDAELTVHNHFMHQRMGFYVAPNGKLLVMGHYGDNRGNSIGRVVREMHDDFTFGPIYFIRLSDKWKGEVSYPMFTESDDPGFIEACNSFLSDKIRRIQWWEEDFLAEDAAEFYMPHKRGKAFCFYTISDSLTIGLFKSRLMTWTKDRGETWKEPFKAESLTHGGAKIWGQKLDNGQYALVYNPTDNSDRQPLCIATSNDGLNFDNMAVVHGEVPEKRFWGIEKRPGPQYVRGIIEGNGNPPSDDLWVVYSVSKEDIWISRIPVPVRRTIEGQVKDNFDEMEAGGVVKNWNIYSPKLCPVRVVDGPNPNGKSLMLKDADPYDYARATRVFGQAVIQRISFEIFIETNPRNFQIDVCDAKGKRLIQFTVDNENHLYANLGEESQLTPETLPGRKWNTISIEYNTALVVYELSVNGRTVARQNKMAGEGNPERIDFRTGDYRLDRKIQENKSGDALIPGFDEPNADYPEEEAVFYLRNFSTKTID